MVEFSSIALYVAIASLVVYIIILIKKRNDDVAESIDINQLEKIAQYFSSTGSLESALRQIVAEQPSSTRKYAEIIKKVDGGMEIEAALFQTMQETLDDFFSKICLMLVSVNRKNDPDLLYRSVQKIKEASELQSSLRTKSEIGAWIIQIVFCIIMPLIFFFMIGTLGFEADAYLNGFLGIIVLSSAVFQGVVFKQWAETIIKVPLLFSAFYILYFNLAPKLLSGLVGPIV